MPGSGPEGGPSPVVLVTTGFQDYGDYIGYATSRPIVAAGGLPLILPFLQTEKAREAALDRADGLLLGFGRDLSPKTYGGGQHPKIGPVSDYQDEFELDLARTAVERGIPVLGICRGMQILNVAFGGSLYADRSEYPGGGVEHPGGDLETWEVVCQATLGYATMPEHPAHPIDVAPGSLLDSLIGTSATVNSYHHQAARRLGKGVEPVAWAPDGVVEAIEMPMAPGFVLAVQWELQQSWMDDRRFLRLFEAFVAAARAGRRQQQAPPPDRWDWEAAPSGCSELLDEPSGLVERE